MEMEIFDSKTTLKFASTNIFLGNEALGAMARIFTNPEKSTATTVNSFDDGLMEAKGGHVVEGEGAKDASIKSKSTSPV